MSMNPYVFSVNIGENTLQIRMSPNFALHRNSWNTNRHCNASYELHFILRGSASLEVENTLYPLNALDGILIAPGKYHYPISVSDNFQRLSVSFLLSDTTLLRQLKTAIPACYVFSLPASFLSTCEAIYEECTAQRLYCKEMLISLCTSLFIGVLRQLDLQHSQKQIAMATDDARIEIIDDFFCDHFAEKGGETKLAAKLHLSKRQLARVLEKLYGMGFQKKLICARMEHAAWLLCNTDMRVSDISMQVGYASETTFYRSFSATFQMTPLQYRKRKDT